MKRSSLRVACYLLSGAVLGACLDVTPLSPMLEQPLADGGTPDAPNADGPVESPCRSCIASDAGSCPAYEQCLRTERCPAFMDCVFDRRCLDLPEWDQRVDCAMPCTEVAGIPDVFDPAIQIGIQINQCALEACGSVCARG